MNYEQKAEEIFRTLFYEPHMSAKEWQDFKKKAIKTCGYGTLNFARDLKSLYKTSHEINRKLNEVKMKVRL